MQALATKWRPQQFSDVYEQSTITAILSKQLDTGQFKNTYLFCGPSGCGKTTIARIFARGINKGMGVPIEIDAASNNGVDNVRQITSDATARSLDSEYKVYIIDECHSLSNAAWQAFLKCIEEPPRYTIFIFCTTDPQKIPATILNRCMRFNFARIRPENIFKCLEKICIEERFNYTPDALEYISKISKGQMRDAISYLDKVSAYGDVCVENVLSTLGNYNYSHYFKLTNAIIDNRQDLVITVIETIYGDGGNLKLFVEQYVDFLLDVLKYLIFKDFGVITIPPTFSEDMENSINFDNAGKYYQYLLNNVMELKTVLNTETNVKDTVEAYMLKLANCL